MQGAIPGRPNRPLVVRCGYDGTVRRVQFPSAATCRLESLRSRVGECFSLSAWSFYLTYTDDDGEVVAIRSEADLSEAIAYFVSGDDDHTLNSDHGRTIGMPAQKFTMRVDVVVEYDGRSLSDTSSIASFPSEGSWNSGSGTSYDGRSRRSYDGQSFRAPTRSSYASRDAQSVVSGLTDLSDLTDPNFQSDPSSATLGRSVGIRSKALAGGILSHRLLRPERTYAEPEPYNGPPNMLASSELGSRWLREQSQLAHRLPRVRTSRQYDSEEDLSDEESIGDIALVRDARGRYYYSYQTETSSLWSRSEGDDGASLGRRISRLSLGNSPPESHQSHAHEVARAPEPSGPPILAPDCSACGVRLEYMRYVCMTCGEADMWTVNAVGKAPFVSPRVPSERSDDESSEGTAGWARAASQSSGTSRTSGTSGHDSAGSTVYNAQRSRSGSLSTNASHASLAVTNGSAASPSSPTFMPEGGEFEARERAPRGYELCPACIEVHGIAHAKAASKAAKAERYEESRRRRKQRVLRHTFREKIWGVEGWIDVEYSEDAECTICRSVLLANRFKCVSCPKFDLCRSCYQKVEEIHPVHAFLSLPDRPLPQLTPVQPAESVAGRVVETRPVHHPGAFCHNCLQDIVGPRFHCAVCPSWDLCIQCEGLGAAGDGQHTADHIMMKIPIPLATAEVEAVSRRARDRWFQQDSSTVAAAHSQSSRSSSPTVDAETVYAPTGTVPAGGRGTPSVSASTHSTATRSAVLTVRDDLDHNARCANCNEWIMGRRYQCANCPSDPEPYNLCSICELRSFRVHDARHVFFKFDRPVHIPLQSPRPLLPLLYKNRVGQVPATAVLSPRDPTAYLKHVLHRDTLCDIHSDQIRGIWLRCAHCAAGFDMCSDAEQIADHDATHVFVVFKARVDMNVFRQLADLGATHPKPLLQQQVYLH